MKKSYHHCSMSIFFVGTTFFITHMHKTIRLTIIYDPSWSSLEEFGSFEDFTAFYIKIDNADPMLLYPDQTPAKYLHLSCIFSPCHTLPNPAVGETVLTPVKWCCNTGEVLIRIKKTMDEQTSGKKLLFSLILYKRLQ